MTRPQHKLMTSPSIPNTAHSRARPGAFYKKIHFCVVMALAFRLSSLGGWTALEDARSKIKDIHQAYQASLKK
ncbi:hypothetical protein Y032_0550g3302 [Ancylostoma ceylanicum]|nr:hypothetical protein Y032_0550g3302 [Ancylostoma ceylanicum]